MRTIKRRYIVFVAFLILILILKPSIAVNVKNLFFEVLCLPFKTTKAFVHLIKTKSSYIRENINLKEQSAVMALELSKSEDILEENERLRGLLDFKKRSSYKATAAEVIGRAPLTWNRIILINKGSKSGIKNRMAVSTAKGLVGTVVEVSEYTSKVMLITDPNSRIGVFLRDSRQSGLMVGSGQGRSRIIYLSFDSEIKLNEEVLTSGFGNIYPKNIPIGKIEFVTKDEIGFYKYADVKPNQDLNSLDEVLCIE